LFGFGVWFFFFFDLSLEDEASDCSPYGLHTPPDLKYSFETIVGPDPFPSVCWPRLHLLLPLAAPPGSSFSTDVFVLALIYSDLPALLTGMNFFFSSFRPLFLVTGLDSPFLFPRAFVAKPFPGNFFVLIHPWCHPSRGVLSSKGVSPTRSVFPPFPSPSIVHLFSSTRAFPQILLLAFGIFFFPSPSPPLRGLASLRRPPRFFDRSRS